MTAPQFQPGEPLSAAKLNRLSAAVDASGIQPGPGLHGESGPSGSSVRATPYRRIGIGRTGGANYPLHPYGSDTIDTSFPFEFVDIDPDLTPVIKERGDAAFTLRNINGHYLPADTMVASMGPRF